MATVLHIEDDPGSRRLVEKLLVKAGHHVVDTDSGLEGVELARTIGPDLVLVDINIPDLDGYEVTLRLRGMPDLDGVPIVAITAEGDRETSLAVGADGFIAKPIDARHFARRVESFLSGHKEFPQDEKTGEDKLREQSHRIVERLEAKVRALSTANADLEEMARLRREFLQNVTHELATPMTPVVGYLKLLLAEELGPLTELQAKSLSAVERATRRLREVTDTLLDVSALESERMHFYDRAFDFSAIAAEAVQASTESAAARNVSIVFRPSDPLMTRGDPDKLRRAIVHVIDNACKHTPRGNDVAVEAVEAGEHLELHVLDGGPGIPEQERERIFEPFVQIDGSATRKHGGVGLGLAFARHVTLAMGGGVSVESPPSVQVAGRALTGTLVTLRVARLTEEAAPPTGG